MENGTIFLVKWKGYELADCTLEPITHIPKPDLELFLKPEVSAGKLSAYANILQEAVQNRLSSTNSKISISFPTDVYSYVFGANANNSLLCLEDFSKLPLRSNWRGHEVFTDWTSLAGAEKLKVLKKLPEKLKDSCVLNVNTEDKIVKLWTDFYQLYLFITSVESANCTVDQIFLRVKGNDHLHQLTSQGKYKMRIDMEDFENIKKYALYDKFSIGSESSDHVLSISDYSGDTGDSMTSHNGLEFSTKEWIRVLMVSNGTTLTLLLMVSNGTTLRVI
ncbi:Hypothetical predicted protein [Mytilus galloprovincialis]|uniref:Fibrinogen C-terminal domain-containing protein n=1 Tax=Mytilus galloprovincialis TaxID=29158 RepID=A0A8B6BPS8_MYTGA|nr:Hypothetical predicted protein [Mytilus galloprovincialis]